MALQRFDMFIDTSTRADLDVVAKATGQSVGALLRRAAGDLLTKQLGPDYRRDVHAFTAELKTDARLSACADALAEALDAMDMEGEENPAGAVMMDLLALLMRAPWPLPRRLEALELLLGHEGVLKVSHKLLMGSRS